MRERALLQGLLEALALGGFAVGPRERARIETVLAGDRGERNGELRALLLKHRERREQFDAIIDGVLRQQDDRLWPPPRPAGPGGGGALGKALECRAAANRAPGAVHRIVISPGGRAGLPIVARPTKRTVTPHREHQAVSPNTLQPANPKGADTHTGPGHGRHHHHTGAHDHRSPHAPGSPLVGGGWLSAGRRWCAVVVLFAQRPLVPPPLPGASGLGPRRRALSLPRLDSGVRLLDTKHRDGIAWGIGKYVSEQFTRPLDTARSVRETARAGGITQLHFEQARHAREVWLWLDRATADPAAAQLARELRSTLREAGLPVTLAYFRDRPVTLWDSAQQLFTPLDLDDWQHTALVLLLTDGQGLLAHYDKSVHTGHTNAVLRTLARWPLLRVAGFGEDCRRLTRLLDEHGLKSIAPTQVAAFLAADPRLVAAPVSTTLWGGRAAMGRGLRLAGGAAAAASGLGA